MPNVRARLWYAAEDDQAATWHDITVDTLVRDGGATIKRGRQSSTSSVVQPSAVGLSIRHDGTYSPRNPLSPLYGKIGRRTPLQLVNGDVPVGAGAASGTSDADHIAPSVTATTTGLLICAWQAWALGNYTPPGGMTTSEQDGTHATAMLGTQAVAAGATGTRTAALSPAARWAAASAVIHGSITIEETLTDVGDNADVTLTTDPATEAGWWLVAVQSVDWDSRDLFPTAPSGGGWVLVADSVATGADFPRVKMWARRVKHGGAQTVTFTRLTAPDVNISHDNRAWLLVLSGVADASVRGTGQVVSWPVAWASPTDVWTPIQAAGLLYWLSRPSRALRSPIVREALSSKTIGLQQYWPCEDGSDSTVIASAVPGQPGGRIIGDVSLAASTAVEGSDPLLRFGSSGIARFDFPLMASTSMLAHRAMWSMPEAGTVADQTRMVDLYSIGGVYRWGVVYLTGGGLSLRGYDETGAQLVTSGSLGFTVDGATVQLGLNLTQSGSDVLWALSARYVAGGVITNQFASSGTFSSVSLGRCGGMALAGSAGLDQVVTGHHMIGTDTGMAGNMASAIIGHRGEAAGRRLLRLCDEEGIPIQIVGDPDDTEAMGAQTSGVLLSLLTDCATVDGGLLADARTAIELEYRTGRSLYNQEPALVLDHADGETWGPAAPTDDDVHVTNDVTVRRVNGSSARVEELGGPLGVDTIGRALTDLPAAAAADERLPDLAGWRLRQGTRDEPRWPSLRINMIALEVAGKADLMADAAALGLRDVIAIDNLPVWMPPGRTRIIGDGVTERISATEWEIVPLALTPAGPHDVGVRDDEQRGHRDTAGSTLAAGIDADDTTISVATTVGPIWTMSQADYPIDLHIRPDDTAPTGEVVRATALGTVLNANPWITESVTGWAASNGSIAYSTAEVWREGYGSILVTPSGAAATSGALDSTRVAVSVGTSYLISGWVYSPSGWSDIGVCCDWHDSGGSYLSTSIPAAVSIPAGLWVHLQATVTAVASATTGAVRVRQTNNPTSGDTWYATAITIVTAADTTASPQTMTVVRGINGVTRAWSAGADVRVYQPAARAL